MGEMEFEQRELVKAVNIAVHEMNQSTEELRLSTFGGRFQVRWDEGGNSVGCADGRERCIGCIIQAPLDIITFKISPILGINASYNITMKAGVRPVTCSFSPSHV